MAEKPESEDSSGTIKIRIESLSDLVFGLALSIGSLGFLTSSSHEVSLLEANIAYFAFSFIILTFTWIGYSRTMAVLPRENETSLYLNLLLLFFVAIEPYLFFLLVTSPTKDVAGTFSVPYALNGGGMFFVQASLAGLVVSENDQNRKRGLKQLNPEIQGRFRRTIVAEVIVGALFLISILPVFWEISTPFGPVRFFFWYSPFVILFVIRGFRARRKESSKGNVTSQSEEQHSTM